ncbi:FAD-dependent monooxygenase [Streptomyces sp. NPDC020799]|uniref:FAD-dependent monooxygenase n=1 Tax=Streptomyces sp. NPDC020799 TaxID=3365091 RepID=UPI00379C0B27
MTTTAVLIVGAGPTGLTLACTLARAGIPVRIVDKSPEFHGGSRGKGLNQRSREVLADLGMGEECTAAGNPRLIYRKYRDGAVIADHVPQEDAAPTPDVPYATGLWIPQWRTEEILRTKLASYGVRVELGTEVTEFTQDESGVTAALADGRRVRASYLVGCDGARGMVRKALGLAFDGETAPELALVGDVEVEGGLDRGYWHQWIDEDGAVLLCPLPGTERWQLQSSPERDAEGRYEEPSLELFQRQLDRHARIPGLRLTNPGWLSTYRVNVRMAERFRVGRVFLAGDAAHIHSIAGGLGMNTGIQDGYNLGWKLALVANGLAGEALLETYEEERLPVAAWTLKITNERLRAVMEGTRKAGVGTEAGAGRDLTTLGVGYAWSSLAWGGRAAGERAPDAPCRDAATGEPVGLFEVFAGPRFTLLGFGPRSAEALARVSAACGTLVRTCLVDGGGEGLADPDGHAWRAYGMAGREEPAADGPGKEGAGGLVLVRPDNHIAWTAAVDRGAEVVDRLERLGR